MFFKKKKGLTIKSDGVYTKPSPKEFIEKTSDDSKHILSNHIDKSDFDISTSKQNQIASTTPTNPAIGALCFDPETHTMKLFDGSSWKILQNQIPQNIVNDMGYLPLSSLEITTFQGA